MLNKATDGCLVFFFCNVLLLCMMQCCARLNIIVPGKITGRVFCFFVLKNLYVDRWWGCCVMDVIYSFRKGNVRNP